MIPDKSRGKDIIVDNVTVGIKWLTNIIVIRV